MTVRRIHSTERYILNSTDIKPVDAIIGSEAWEEDTKDTYVVYDKISGIANWTLKKVE